MSTENTQFYIAGDIYLDVFDASFQPQGLIGHMNGEALSVAPENDRVDQLSKMRDTYGQVRNSVTIPKPSSLTLALRDVPTEVLAMAFGGDIALLSEAAHTVTDEAVTARIGKWIDLQYRNIDASSVVVTDSGGTVTYSEGVDYEINHRLGMIRAMPGGAITDGQSLMVDYSASAVSGERISALTRSQIKARIVIDGINMAKENRQVHAEIFRATLSPDGALDLLSEEHITASFSGTMETPVGKNTPFVLDYLS